MHRCQNESCSQHPPLRQTSFSITQGCTHYCNICGWGYWTHIIKPELDVIRAAEKANPKYTRDAVIVAMTREILRPLPDAALRSVAEKMRLKHLGGFQPFWMKEKDKKIWKAKYLKEFPPPPEIKKSYIYK